MDPNELPTLLSKPELRELYQRLGSPDDRPEILEKILLDFYQRMADDVMIGFFFQGRDVVAIALKQKEFMLKAFGVAPSYSGKAPADAHHSLPPIRLGQFNRRIQLLEQTLQDHALSPQDIQTWLSFENAFRDGIVG